MNLQVLRSIFSGDCRQQPDAHSSGHAISGAATSTGTALYNYIRYVEDRRQTEQ
jgi:hypothetical protein